MSDPLRVLLVGATGLVGRKVIARGRNVPGLALMALARREMQLPRGARMEMLLAPSENWAEAIAAIAPDAVICALGTTRRKAGEDGLAAVDEELVLAVAKAAREAGTRQFVFVSSVGADPLARNAYLATKGRAEDKLRKLRFARLDILRPGLLRGRRWDDPRPAERAGQWLAPLADLFLQGGLTRYRSIKAYDLAGAALQLVLEKAAGTFVHEHDSLQRLQKRFAPPASPASQTVTGKAVPS